MSSPTLNNSEVAAYPTVLFDTKLGKSVKFIDFDYDEYYEHLSSQGLSDEQIALSQINVLPHSGISPRAGKVDLDTGKLTVKTSNEINRSFLHESQHLIDYFNDPPTDSEKRYVKAHKIGMLYAPPVFMAEAFASDYLLDQPKEVGSVFLGIAAVSFVLSAFAYYYSTREKRARTAEKADRQFFEITKK